MALNAGDRLGAYEIAARLGAGGMGEVYRARDTRLSRDVALKLLRDEVAIAPGGVERFTREARCASGLNHPNIVTIYEIGWLGTAPYIAMEFVPGETLRQKLADGPLPIEKLLSIALQVAKALTVAHLGGIVHRDLKPENIVIREDGLVKLLDFGLAKTVVPHLAEDETTEAITNAGAILGTAAYMSPEQARAGAVDFRSDQFSFGAVLYEMATGRRAFQRSTFVETLAAVLRDEPASISEFNSQLPSPLHWTVARCLAKDPAGRYAATEDLGRELAVINDHLAELPAPGHANPRNNLPAPCSPLVGRDRELSAVKELLLRREVRLLTLTGPAGTGKTRLALQLASEVADKFSGGVSLIPLAPISDPALVLATIALTLGVRQGESLLQQVIAQLRRAPPTLLLLDNFEQVLAGASVVSDLLAGCPGLKVVVTSREVLRIYGEHEFFVPPLAFPDPVQLPPVETLQRFPAIALFQQRVMAVRHNFAWTDENIRCATLICARLDGLPLAIELAAARVKLLPLPEILSRLHSRLALLTGGARDLPERHQTLRRAIDWSYELLTPTEQKLFRRLAVFAAGCTLDGVEAVCNSKADLEGDLFEAMASLVDKSLLQIVYEGKGDTRFQMLETVREYALERLESSAEAHASRRAHAAYFVVLAEEGQAYLAGPEQGVWFDRFDLEQADLRAALDWLTKTGNAEWGLRLGTALFLYWHRHAHPAEGRKRLAALLELPAAAERTRLRARALWAGGSLAMEEADPVTSRKLLHEALEIYRELGDHAGIVATLGNLAIICRDQRDYAVARSFLMECVRLLEAAGDRISAARAMSSLALVTRKEGDFAAALALQNECLSIFREQGDPAEVAWSLSHLGDIAREQENGEAAHSLYEEAISLFRELEQPASVARCLFDLGRLALDEEKPLAARKFLGEALTIFAELGDTRDILRALEEIVCCTVSEGRFRTALRLAGAAEDLRHRFSTPRAASAAPKLERAVAAARVRVDNVEAANAWIEGGSMPIGRAVQYALDDQD